jgi:hypothetical protein
VLLERGLRTTGKPIERTSPGAVFGVSTGALVSELVRV